MRARVNSPTLRVLEAFSGGTGRSYADAPEIDGVVQLLPPL